MNILLFGATGMVGQGVLRECVLAEDVAHVLCIGRTSVAQTHPKLKEIVLDDLFHLCIRSKTAWYRIVYSLARPVLSLLRALMPDAVLTTEILGQAMLAVARTGAPKQVLSGADIRALASTASIRRM